MTSAEFNVENLDRASVVAVARQGARVALGEEARERVRSSRGRVEIMIEGPLPVYGVTTGFGALANSRITAEKRIELQHSLLRSHAAGPEYGSMGASGDLAPLAHVGLCLLGEGRLLEGGEPVQTGEVLERAGIRPFRLATKEGLALINGTDGMLAMLLLSLEDLQVLLKTADVTAGMSVEALFGTDRGFKADLHLLRAH